MIMQIIIILIT